MAKGDMMGAAGINPANLAQIVSRMKSSAGGGQMGPGQFAGVMPRQPQAPGMAPNNQPYPNPSMSLNARPMMGGFQMPQPTGQANPMASASGAIQQNLQQTGGMKIGPDGNPMMSGTPSAEPFANPVRRLGYGGGNTGIGGLGRSAGMEYIG